jgi:hypothetical protein
MAQMTMRAVISVLILSTAFAQTKSAKPKPVHPRPSPPAQISGRVFLVTNGGDLKPARMAAVYMLMELGLPYVSSDGRTVPMPEAGILLAGLKFLSQYLDLTAAEDDHIEIRRYSTDEGKAQYRCNRNIQIHNQALRMTLDWAIVQRKTDQVLFVRADEEGNFEFTVPRPGEYYVLASGRAGLNDAFWKSETFWIEPGKSYTVKLPDPETACLTME